MCHLVKSEQILQVTSTALDELLLTQKLRMPKNSSKASKIRKLLQSETVQNNLNKEELDAVEKRLQEIDEKRKKKARKQDADDHEDEGEEGQEDRFLTHDTNFNNNKVQLA